MLLFIIEKALKKYQSFEKHYGSIVLLHRKMFSPFSITNVRFSFYILVALQIPLWGHSSISKIRAFSSMNFAWLSLAFPSSCCLSFRFWAFPTYSSCLFLFHFHSHMLGKKFYGYSDVSFTKAYKSIGLDGLRTCHENFNWCFLFLFLLTEIMENKVHKHVVNSWLIYDITGEMQELDSANHGEKKQWPSMTPEEEDLISRLHRLLGDR